MNKIEEQSENHKMEIIMGNLLRAGVLIAASIVLCGGIIYLFHYGFTHVNYSTFHSVSYDLCNLNGILKSAFSFQGRGLIQLGLLVLVATPVARVFFSIFAFIGQRDILYVIVTLIVFFILIHSLLNG